MRYQFRKRTLPYSFKFPETISNKSQPRFYHWALADLGGLPGARPIMVQILLFRHTKFSKRNRLGSPHPPMRFTPLLREILDPPLLGVAIGIGKIAVLLCIDALADLGGAHPARAPQGTQFFHFDIQIL